jgi:hypothetical protein
VRFAAIVLCAASQRVFFVVDLVIDTRNVWIHSCILCTTNPGKCLLSLTALPANPIPHDQVVAPGQCRRKGKGVGATRP